MQAALGDEAVSVREAALDLLGKYIVQDVRYAEGYLDLLVTASQVRPPVRPGPEAAGATRPPLALPSRPA